MHDYPPNNLDVLIYIQIVCLDSFIAKTANRPNIMLAKNSTNFPSTTDTQFVFDLRWCGMDMYIRNEFDLVNNQYLIYLEPETIKLVTK